MALVLPNVPGEPFYDFSIDLEGSTFLFTFRWNDRAGAWFMTVGNEAGDIFLADRKVVLRFPLLLRSVDARLPKGELLAVDTAGSDVEPGLADLGDRVILTYTPSTDFP